MKKFLCIFLASILFVGGLCMNAYATDTAQYPNKREDILIRDPFVLVHDGKYYLYGTGASSNGYGCYVSEDLENWSKPVTVFAPTPGFDGKGCYWAPECHEYKDKFYLFATYLSEASGKRGVATFIAESPLGPFEPLSDGHLTPKDSDAIDGTLYVDESGQPWMAYVREWTSSEDGIGEMAISKMSDDLSSLIGESKVIFRANEPLWADGNAVTDAPCLYRTSKGKLLMLWSNGSDSGYTVGIVQSDNGKIDGNWSHQCLPLYQRGTVHEYDGGHAMIFTSLDGKMMMSIHSPNSSGDGVHETPTFIPVKDIGGTLLLDDAPNAFFRVLYFIKKCVLTAYYSISDLFVLKK